jgi:hypothetical protein
MPDHDPLYNDLAQKAREHAHRHDLTDKWAYGFLNAMWPTIAAAVRDGGRVVVSPSVPSIEGGPWTRHGHPVAGVTVVGNNIGRPPVARCGGPGMCAQCALDSQRMRAEARTDPGPHEHVYRCQDCDEIGRGPAHIDGSDDA